MDKLKGWRTFAIGLALAIGPPALSYLSVVNWNNLVSPQWAFAISGVIMFVMRAVTSTAPGKSS